MGMVGSYLKAFVDGAIHPFRVWTFVCPTPWDEEVMRLGHRHGCWLGRWLRGRPTRAMIFKLFVLLSGLLLGIGYICIDVYYRPLTGIVIGTVGLVMFALWGISEDDLKDQP